MRRPGKKRVWVCRLEWFEYSEGTPRCQSSILCRYKDKIPVIVYARFVGGDLQSVLGVSTKVMKLGGGYQSRDGCDPQEPPRFRLRKKILERRVLYGGRKGRSAARRLGK